MAVGTTPLEKRPRVQQKIGSKRWCQRTRGISDLRAAVGMDWRKKFIVTFTVDGKHQYTCSGFSLESVWRITEEPVEAIEIVTAVATIALGAAFLDRENPAKAFRDAAYGLIAPEDWSAGDEKALSRMAHLTERVVKNLRFDTTRTKGGLKRYAGVDW